MDVALWWTILQSGLANTSPHGKCRCPDANLVRGHRRLQAASTRTRISLMTASLLGEDLSKIGDHPANLWYDLPNWLKTGDKICYLSIGERKINQINQSPPNVTEIICRDNVIYVSTDALEIIIEAISCLWMKWRHFCFSAWRVISLFFLFLLLSHPGIPGVTLCFCTGSYAAAGAAAAAGRRFLSTR